MDAVVTIITTIETGYFVFFSTNILFTNVWPDFYYFIIILVSRPSCLLGIVRCTMCMFFFILLMMMVNFIWKNLPDIFVNFQ